MSYNILYKRLFIALTGDRYILMAQTGDSNLYETNPKTKKQRRVREWGSLNLGGNSPIVTKEEVDAWLKRRASFAKDAALQDFQQQGFVPATCQDPAKTDWKRHFGWYIGTAIGTHSPRNTQWTAVTAFFTGGLRRAVALEDFVKATGPIHLQYRAKDADGRPGYFQNSGLIFTETELEKTLLETAELSCDKKIWAVPAYGSGALLDAACEGVFLAEPYCAAVLNMIFRTEDGPSRSEYLKNIVPLRTTADKAEALHIPREGIDGLFRLLQHQDGTLKGISYEFI